MDRWIVAGGILFIAIGGLIIVPFPLDGSWLWYWEFGLDPWFDVLLSVSSILLGVFLVALGLKESSSIPGSKVTKESG